MPRGVYPRKRSTASKTSGSALGGESSEEERGSGPIPVNSLEVLRRASPTKTCAFCLWFWPGKDFVDVEVSLGRCHFFPAPELVRGDHWCAQWRGKP